MMADAATGDEYIFVMRKGWVATIAMGCLVAVCGSASHSAAPPTSTTTPATTPSTTTPSTTTPSTTTPSTTSPPTVQNLAISTAVRAQLVAAGAALNGLGPSDYTGLAVGSTYYAYDSATANYWAGASLVASSTSLRAQVSTQDDGSYLVFHRSSGGSWTAAAVGLAGIAGSTCPLVVPAPVLASWGWPAGGCHPRR